MSLINDALKQARQSQQPNQPDGQLPLRPVAPVPRGAAHWMLPLVVIALVSAAAFFIWLALAGHKTPELSAAHPAPPAPPVAIVTNPPVVSNNAAAAPSLLPPPKLQGIIYGQKSWAIVDGKTVYVGDSVDSFRVKEITPDSITLESPDGSEKKLVLGE